MAEVHIIGAGPVGSLAAISALKNGHDVIVSEEHASAGSPENCSGLFSRDGLESLHIDYRKLIVNPIYGADIHIGSEKLEIRRDDPVGFVLDRGQLDYSLAQKAQDMGAKINFNERVKGNFYSRTIIGADGPMSHVASHFRFPKISSFASTMQETLPFSSEDPHIVQVFLSSRFPGFFGWIIPKDEDFAEFGAGVKVPNQPAPAFRHLLKMKSLAPKKPRGWLIPISTRKKTSMKNGYNVLLAGDAAGQVKSTTGGGVIFGGYCAEIAGRTLDPLKYDIEWNLRYGPDLKIHNLVHSFLENKSEKELSRLGQRLKKLNCDGFLSNFGHMDKPTKMIGPQIMAHLLKVF